MGFFATKTRRNSADDSEARAELSELTRQGLPNQFEAVGEALASGSGSVAACEVAGRLLARDGASLDEALELLSRTTHLVTGQEPAFVDVRALSMAWSESTLAYLHQLSCEDPLTGLASLAHIRSRLSELYRGQLGPSAAEPGDLGETHALVVVELPEDRPGRVAPGDDHFTRAMRLTRLGEIVRTVFSGTETIGRSGTNRVVVIVERDARLGRRVALLRKMLATADHPTRVWIEGLPPTDDGAASLLDELCRH
ncbi:hypothetical protein ASG90_11430 [Nocardioides sp. Soil797]|nr:hypothetical protein ASG90_11430 [Nocardioides sp. Soil797]